MSCVVFRHSEVFSPFFRYNNIHYETPPLCTSPSQFFPKGDLFKLVRNFFSSSVCCSGNLLTKQPVLRNELNRQKQSCLQLTIYFIFVFDQVNHQFHNYINFGTRNTLHTKTQALPYLLCLILREFYPPSESEQKDVREFAFTRCRTSFYPYKFTTCTLL